MSRPTRTSITRFLTRAAPRLGPVDAGEVTVGQIAAIAGGGLVRLGVNLAGGIIALTAFTDVITPWLLALWLATLVAVHGRAIWYARDDHLAGAPVRRRDVGRVVGDALAAALVWAVPVVCAAPLFDTYHALTLAVVLAMLMVPCALSLAALPRAMAAFVLPTGAALSLALLLAGFPSLSVAAIGFMAAVLWGGMIRAADLATIRTGAQDLAERDETVSLLLREFEEGGADWLWETDAARRATRASPRFAYALGLNPAEINGIPILQLLAGEAWETGEFTAGLRVFADRLKAREPFRDLLLPVTLNGDARWWELSASPKYDDAGLFVGMRGVGSDVTEQRRSADHISRLARFDTLTGLPNRLMIHETLERALIDAEKWGNRSAFMMIDLDRFKAVNDTLGHPIGDKLLGQVSERLAGVVGTRAMCGRLGGDEFAMVVRDAHDTGELELFGKAVIEALSRPYEVDRHTLYIGASVGVAVAPRDGRTAETLIRSADLALYRSKDAGGGLVHSYEPQLHVRAEERRILEIALRAALANGEFHLNYQPIVKAGDGQLTGFETLLRWTHPEMGPISPAKFVQVAEEARLIAPIGEWVLRTACDEAARWPGNISVSVNVSPEQLHDGGFVSTVISALANSGLPASRLELEVTESAFLAEGTRAIQVLERILDLGVRLSLDDFGTGYSSLGYLSRTRFSTIKIDRSFVQGASKNERECLAIVRAVVALAQSLGMTTTAEGVETEHEHHMIRELGCTKIQGYYFGRPLPVEEARALVGAGRSAIAA